MNKFAGKVVVVTGGSSGIGLATAKRLRFGGSPTMSGASAGRTGRSRPRYPPRPGLVLGRARMAHPLDVAFPDFPPEELRQDVPDEARQRVIAAESGDAGGAVGAPRAVCAATWRTRTGSSIR